MIIEAVALSRDVPASRVIRASLGELDLAVWRSASGVLSAWENRCPHRGMRLSHGFVRGERLACLYHGWHYSTKGFCEIIPAHPELTPPRTFCTAQYGVIENTGIIWVSNERTDTLPDHTQPTLLVPTLPDQLQAIRSLSFKASVANVTRAFYENPPPDMVSSKFSGSVASENILQFDDPSGMCGALLLLHSSQGNNVTVHVLGGEQCSVDELMNLSRWSESVRRYAEQHAGAAT